ncbi:MAG: HAMP domain-containing histidine kinase [bacterium]|nr:HAMP domain-containing histidine kinase [bacterium]
MTGLPPTILPGPLLLPTATFRSTTLKSFVRVRWFIRLRWLAVAASFVVVLLAVWSSQGRPRPWSALAVVAVLAFCNAVWMNWSRRLRIASDRQPPDEQHLYKQVVRFANAQIAVDLLLLTLVLHYFGATCNPMAMFYLFHMVIASLLLRPLIALLQGVWAMALFGALLLAEHSGWLTVAHPLFGSEPFAGLHTHGDLVIKTYVAVCFGVFATLHLTSQVATALDTRETEVRSRDLALERSRQEIEELIVRRARFMRTAAHQLKSPLTGIKTMAGLIADGVVEGPAAAELIGRIVRRCADAIGQVEELLTLARIKESPASRHRVARTHLADVINTVAEKFRPLAESQGLELVCDLPPGQDDLPRPSSCVRVDARDLEDCLTNLVDNSFKYTHQGGRVEVSCACNRSEAVVQIRDTGVGIDPELLETIFDEFRRGHQALATRIPGSGLGLSIVREIVEQAGGSVTVRSPLGKPDAEADGRGPGSEFELRLPLCREPEAI